jgi:pSer/pThr/pTyr-binding forkhead associated (FHA) protein
MPRITVRAADGTRPQFAVPVGDTPVGRGKDCGLVVAGEGVSRRHAVLRWNGRKCEIKDDGSLNGTFVNGRRVRTATLKHGDEIRLGPTLVLEFAVDAAPEPGGIPKFEREQVPEPEVSRFSEFEPGQSPAPEPGGIPKFEREQAPEPEVSRFSEFEPGQSPAPEPGGIRKFEREQAPEPEVSRFSEFEPGGFPEPGRGRSAEPEASGIPKFEREQRPEAEVSGFPEFEPGRFPEPGPGGFPEPPRPGSQRRGGWWRRRELLLRTSVAGRDVVHRITHASLTVGTDPDSGLRLQGNGVSRLHARLDQRGGRVTICDLKSAEGTHVNGRRTMRAELVDGDQVRLGEVELLVTVRSTTAWDRIAVVAAVLVGTVATAVITPRVVARVQERQAVAKKRVQVERAAVAALEDGIASYRQRRFDLACGHLRYAADLLLLSKAAPSGATLARANAMFEQIAQRLPEGERGFDFAAVFDSATAAESRAEIENLSDSAYVLREVRRIAVEVGQSEEVPAGFADGVWLYVQETMQHPGKFEAALRRSAAIQPVLLRILGEARLPRVFAYVAWVESDLDPGAGSLAGAVGLWQFMRTTAGRYHLRVAGGYDERTSVELSTRAATAYISDLILIFGPEQFMCAMASYNRGEGGVQGAMMKIPQQLTMMPSSKKYWYLVEHGLLPDETRRYVPRVFATKIMAENPARFGFSRP